MGRYRHHLRRAGRARPSSGAAAGAERGAAPLLMCAASHELFGDDGRYPVARRPTPDLVERHASGLLLGEAVDGAHVLRPSRRPADAHPPGRAPRYSRERGGDRVRRPPGSTPIPTSSPRATASDRDVDLTGRDRTCSRQTHDDAWHGTMTTVACAGNGYLSNGLYRGIAREAELVLLAVGREGHIREHGRGARAGVGARAPRGARHPRGQLLAGRRGRRLVPRQRGGRGRGAARASGRGGGGRRRKRPVAPEPPANAPSVVTVGGLVDKNVAQEMAFAPYRSQYGITRDGLTSPRSALRARSWPRRSCPGPRCSTRRARSTSPARSRRRSYAKRWPKSPSWESSRPPG